jgi:hypothetical protein
VFHLRRPRLGFTGLWLLAMVLQLLLWFPWHPQVLKPGLDSSYEYALNEMFVDCVQFAGSVHPYGPYGFLKNDVYHPATFRLLMAVRLALFAVFALLVARVASRWTPSWRWAALWIVLLVAVARYGEPYFLSLAMLASLAFWSAATFEDRIRWAPVAIVLSLASLMHFTYALMIVVLVALMVLAGVLEGRCGRTAEAAARRWARAAAILAWPSLYLAGVVLLWMAAGQEPARLVEYVVSRLRLSAGHGESAALAGPAYRLVAFTLAGCAFWVVFMAQELRRSGRRALVPALGLGLWLALAAKHSFYRHDAAHAAYGAFQGLCMAVIFGLMMLRPREPGARQERRAAALAAIAVMVAASLSLITYDREHWYGARFFRHLDLRTTAVRIVRFVAQPSYIHARHELALARIRAAHPLPRLEGTVDVYPWELSLAFAHHLALDSRPALLSFLAGDAQLLAADAVHLAAADGPDHVLLRIGSLDHQLPATGESLSWPVLLAGFRLRSAGGSHLVLDRAVSQRSVELSEPTPHELAFGERLTVGAGPERLLWLRAELVRTRLGGLVSLAWRGPIVYLRVKLNGGGERWYRMAPGAARTGFLLSPLVADNAGFVALLDETWPDRLAGQQVRDLSLHTEFGDGWYWKPRFRIELQDLTIR